jgi:hypothetical protein
MTNYKKQLFSSREIETSFFQSKCCEKERTLNNKNTQITSFVKHLFFNVGIFQMC